MANGAMKTVPFISRSPTPSPMNSNHRRFCVAQGIFEPWQWKRRRKRNRFEQTSRTLKENIDAFNQDQLVKKDVLMPVNNVFLRNLPDVEEMPSHDGETVQFSRIMICLIFVYLSYSPCLFRFFVCFRFSSENIPWKGKKEYVPLQTAYDQDSPVMACSQKQGSLRARRSKSKLKLLDIRIAERRKRGERRNARGARAGVTFCISSSNLSVKTTF
ncbi:hypothetical protein TNCV_4522031 [Trichonephila clavipes]|nr:hypothetical protein TNCV_4522031 [Trichonephila clavipes]